MKSQQTIATIIILISLQAKKYGQESITSACGKRLIHHTAIIYNGLPSNEGDWPWHAAIFHLSGANKKYKCGGTVLNRNTILTAAHCVLEYNRPIIPDRLTVQLGTHNKDVPGTNTQHFTAHEVIPHPNYSLSDMSNDIAIIRLATEATLNNYIQPICLWDPNKAEIAEIIGRNGTVIGWGLTETDELSSFLRYAKIPIVSFYTCLNSNRNVYGSLLTENSLCAGFRNGTNVCTGDSGGSLTFEENGAYYIRGIGSFSPSRKSNRQFCDSYEYAVFTDVTKYISWIEDVVPQLKSESTPQLKSESTPQLKSESTPQLKSESTPQLKSENTPQLKSKSSICDRIIKPKEDGSKLADSDRCLLAPLFRLYHPITDDHLYTTSVSEEFHAATNVGYTREVSPGLVATSSCGGLLQPVYRLYKRGTGNVFRDDHFYTHKLSEATSATREGGYVWDAVNGIGFYCAASKTCGASLPLHRYLRGFDHFYTTDMNEGHESTTIAPPIGVLVGGVVYEGILCYIWAPE